LSSIFIRLCTWGRLGGLGAEAIDEAHLLGQHRLLALVLGLAPGGLERAGLLVEVVVAAVGAHLASIDLDDLGDHAVLHVAIVAGHEDRAGIGAQEGLEPEDRLEVEVVGRLVEEQDLGPGQEDAGKGHAHPPATRELADVALDLSGAKAEPGQDGLGARAELVAAQLLVAGLHLAVAGDDRVEVLVGLGHAGLEGGQLDAQGGGLAGAGHGLGQHRAAARVAGVLAEVADGEPAGPLDVAGVRRFLADDEPEQRGLAGAVGADQADLLTRVELERGVDEQELRAVLLADVGERDHGRARAGADS
jgi:hypothetical protein